MQFPHFQSSKKPFWMAITVFVLLVTVLISTITPGKQAFQQESEIKMEKQIDTVTNHFSTGLEVYIQTLYGARGLMTASETVTRKEWQIFYQNIGVTKRLPGLAAIGYIQHVPLSDKATFEARHREQDDESITKPFEIRPNIVKSDYNVLTFVAPLDTEALRSTLGFDYDSEIVRKAALEKARDLNQPVIAGPLQTLGTKLPGFLTILPVYNKNLPRSTTLERQTAYQGAVMVAFRNQELFNQAFSELDLSTTSVKIYDGESLTDDHLMFDSANSYRILGVTSESKVNSNTRRTIRKIAVADRVWTLEYHYILPGSTNFIFPSIYTRLAILALTNFVCAMFVYHWMQLKKN